MLDLLGEGFRRHLPSRRTTDGSTRLLDDGPSKSNTRPTGDKTSETSPKRRRPNNTDPYKGSSLRRQAERKLRQARSPTPQDQGSKRKKEETESSPTAQAALDRPLTSAPKDAVLQQPKVPAPPAQSLEQIIASHDAEAILEQIAPGIAKGLKKEEIVNLLRSSERPPMWSAEAKNNLRLEKDGTLSRPKRLWEASLRVREINRRWRGGHQIRGQRRYGQVSPQVSLLR